MFEQLASRNNNLDSGWNKLQSFIQKHKLKTLCFCWSTGRIKLIKPLIKDYILEPRTKNCPANKANKAVNYNQQLKQPNKSIPAVEMNSGTLR